LKIIFLDVDGPLNTDDYLVKQCDEHPKGRLYSYEAQFNFDPMVMTNLQKIAKDENTKIVVSSTWRLSRDEFKIWKVDPESVKDEYWDALIRNLKEYNLDHKVIGVTPHLTDNRCNSLARGKEIKHYLRNHPNLNVESFVIIDDDSDMEDMTETHLAKCEWEDGITDIVAERAIEILSKPNMIEL